MMRLLQAALLVLLPAPVLAEPEKLFQYLSPVVEKPLFGKAVDMLEQERDEYAGNLAGYAANSVVEREASADSLEMARRILALALHLSPRNKDALVTNFQLKKGVIPRERQGDYSPAVLSRLLLTRGRLLGEKDTHEERLLSRCFVELAAVIDPRNEDAVFAYELQRLDGGDVDWSAITDSPAVDDNSGQG